MNQFFFSLIVFIWVLPTIFNLISAKIFDFGKKDRALLYMPVMNLFITSIILCLYSVAIFLKIKKVIKKIFFKV